jgi:hypothetical protein
VLYVILVGWWPVLLSRPLVAGTNSSGDLTTPCTEKSVLLYAED